MSIVAPPLRLASASVVLFGQRGDVTQHAHQRGVSRQRLYREADSVLRDLDLSVQLQEIDRLHQQTAVLQERIDGLQAELGLAVVIDADRQAELACTAQAEGVSLPVARRLLAVLLRDKASSVAQLGRHSRQAGLRAGPLLKVFDEQARPRVHQGAGDEIFFEQKPVLMVVEPESQCWLAGQLSANRNGEAWAKELEAFANLEHLARDGGTGLENGVARCNEQRQQHGQKPIAEQLDHFHTLHEGRCALRKTQALAERAWTAEEQADKKVARRHRHGQARTGYATQAARKWQKAEAAFHQWEAAEGAFEHIRQALRPFTATGELNSREKAVEAVAQVLPALAGEQWDKFKRQLQRPETYTYLDRLPGQIEALPVAPEVRQAVVRGEGIRQTPELVRGDGRQQAVLRGLLLVWSVLIAKAGQAGQQAVAALRCVGRASSCVEGLNSVVRMQQGRHRKMTQELLDLKRLYWNLRKFRTGRRKKTSPYQRLGLALPPELSWWQLLHMPPDQLRTLLSAQPMAA
jgi:hypothetical protein